MWAILVIVSDYVAIAGALTIFISTIFGICVWLFGMRPYLIKRGGLVVTGATWGVTAWADWNVCREFARAHQDAHAARWAKAFLMAQLAWLVGLILFIAGPAFRAL